MSKFSQGNTKAAKLTNEQVYEMRQKYADGGYSQAQLAREYHIHINTAGSILRGTSRVHVPMPASDAEIAASQARFEAMLKIPSGGALVRLTDEVAALPSIKAERNLRELENWDAASKFGVVKGDSQ